MPAPDLTKVPIEPDAEWHAWKASSLLTGPKVDIAAAQAHATVSRALSSLPVKTIYSAEAAKATLGAAP